MVIPENCGREQVVGVVVALAVVITTSTPKSCSSVVTPSPPTQFLREISRQKWRPGRQESMLQLLPSARLPPGSVLGPTCIDKEL